MPPSFTHNCDVIVVNYNAGKLIGECVASALREGALRVIVVDNASSDGSLAFLDAFLASGRLSIVRNTRNMGFASACNTGAGVSDAGALLFLNPDCVLMPCSLRYMMDALHSDPATGMVGGFLCNPDGSEQPGGRRVFPTPRRAFVRAFGLSRLDWLFPSLCSDFLLHREPLPTAPVAVEAISGACMLVKRETLKPVGLWDEGYFLHCEDLDWCMRFKLQQWRVLFVPQARVMHWRGTCSRDRPFFVEWHKHRGMVRFYQKFFRAQYPKWLWGWVILGVWLRFCLVSTYHAFKWGLRRGRSA
ncbi:glycosyltransferase family 2 protein [Pseudomonas sp. MPB23]|uniref:glycosyltransferase family 2 protein n=1 Tax=Pseudomonas sp. MPB23 TaxID=3388490 RepID=UPI003984DB1D